MYTFLLISCSIGNKNKEMKTLTITETTIQSSFNAKPDESINIEKVKEHYQKYPERWKAAFKFLIKSDLKSIEPGRIDLNENVFVVISEYETKNQEDAKYESHRKYIDIQYLISGEELIGLTNKIDLNEISPYSESNDITFYDYDGGKMLFASPTNYFIFFPDDKHRPCMKIEEAEKVKKVVVKIRYN